jgi:predicted flap endonuclease-1-like 5' DNA nuclease
MPYTLMKGLGWFVLALVLGIVIGWLLRSVVAKRQVARARNHHVDSAEMERLRGRVANLEPIVAERDRLRAELDAALAVAAAKASSKKTKTAAPDVAPPRFADGASDQDTVATATPPTEAAVPSTPDISAGAGALGHPIVLDDLKVVEGIGPKIELLCHGIGIRTWHDLSTTEVSLLRTMLADAGPRFRTHDPATWPEQARLLAAGRWDDFKALAASYKGGRADAAVPDATSTPNE